MNCISAEPSGWEFSQQNGLTFAQGVFKSGDRVETMWDTDGKTYPDKWETAANFEADKNSSWPHCAAKQRYFCDMTDSHCHSLQQFKTRLSGQDVMGCKAEWIEHKVFKKGNYQPGVAFLGLILQNKGIKAAGMGLAKELLKAVQKKEHITAFDADMQIKFESAERGNGWHGVVVGRHK